MTLLTSPQFCDALDRLESVTLNPRRHTAPNARAHSLEVAERARALAAHNGRSAKEIELLGDLGLAHDIGKITGTANMAASVDVLSDLGIDEPTLLGLVKRHDVNLPWYLAAERGEAPTARAWNRLARSVEMDLLALFMVADRVDAPGGWWRNAPLRWFLDQARERELIGELKLELPGSASEISAGGVLVDSGKALVIRVRDRWELPKGGVEFDELVSEAATREVREEAGVACELVTGDELGTVEYDVQSHRKRVHYFALSAAGTSELGPLPSATRERRWVDSADVATLELVSETLRPIIERALKQK